jgi:metal-responsive CopG/Arc/MetJ family transcriptional regulator
MRNVLSVSLPEKMAQELNSFAKATGRNKSDILKESLGNYLWEIKFKETKKLLSTKAKKAGIISEDDAFKMVS